LAALRKRYILAVLWMTPCFRIHNGPMTATENDTTGKIAELSATTFCSICCECRMQSNRWSLSTCSDTSCRLSTLVRSTDARRTHPPLQPTSPRHQRWHPVHHSTGRPVGSMLQLKSDSMALMVRMFPDVRPPSGIIVFTPLLTLSLHAVDIQYVAKYG